MGGSLGVMSAIAPAEEPSEQPPRDGAPRPSLAVLKDVQKAYERRLQVVDKVGGRNKLRMRADVLHMWVGDLSAQNELLVEAVEALEVVVTTRLQAERDRHQETESELRLEAAALVRRLARKDSDLRGLVEVLRRLREFDYCTLEGIHFHEVTEADIFGSISWRQKKMEQGDTNRDPERQSSNVKDLKALNDTLQKENLAKDREIRRLNKDVQQYEQTIMNMRGETLSSSFRPEDSRKDAEVMVALCLKSEVDGGPAEVVGFGPLLREQALRFEERRRRIEGNLKSSNESERTLRKVNVGLSEEVHALRRVCAALDEQARAAGLRAQFKDDIIREMRRQLRQAKARLKELTGTGTGAGAECKSATNASGDRAARAAAALVLAGPSASAAAAGVAGSSGWGQLQQQRRRSGPPRGPGAEDDRTPRLDGSGDDRLPPQAPTPHTSADH